MIKTLIYDLYNTKIGTIVSVFDNKTLCILDFQEYERRYVQALTKAYKDFTLVKQHDPYKFRSVITRYLEGELNVFENTDVVVSGTDFQKNVWLALRNIPAGQTICYADLARNINHVKAVRAVGYAISLNPIALVLPCHRVIGRNGNLTGYAGGLERKKWLLAHEKAIVP